MLWFIMLALIGSSLWVWLIRRNQWRRLLPEGNWIVTFDEQGVAVTAPPGGRREANGRTFQGSPSAPPMTGRGARTCFGGSTRTDLPKRLSCFRAERQGN